VKKTRGRTVLGFTLLATVLWGCGSSGNSSNSIVGNWTRTQFIQDGKAQKPSGEVDIQSDGKIIVSANGLSIQGTWKDLGNNRMLMHTKFFGNITETYNVNGDTLKIATGTTRETYKRK
jgi:hypothetical protein